MIHAVCVCGARPNFMKIAPLMEAFAGTRRIRTTLVHTGQHYDERMSALFFRQLGIPEPDVNLEVGSGSHAVQTAEIMRRFEPTLESQRPDWVIVVGDVNSTIACALVAVKLQIRVAHVEAGLRSFDRTMPEEINRLLTDAISDLLLVSEESGVVNLRREGIEEGKIAFVGNVMIDTLLKHRSRADESRILGELGLAPRRYAVVTLHRPSNVDRAEALADILTAFETITREIDVVFPMHPRTRKNVAAFGLESRITSLPRLKIVEPLGYLDYVRLMTDASIVLTDSGGVQEETTILGVPCLTLRPSTERPATITHGTNRLVPIGRDGYPTAAEIIAAYQAAPIRPFGRAERPKADRQPPLWDGRAAERIAARLLEGA
ncbi:MAG: UDP-N-acetylglucosamine 2-epimerase (non-hydrolyzing) [Phycisphaerae bacterium]|nr:UDP-N-acetylglucosamine 2-epimerase (non-hydrolyzing) [Phycisphaerae bacterium]